MKNSLLEEYGSAVLKNGYNVVPIDAGMKRPTIFGWTQINATERDLREWAMTPGRGVGIATKNTPAIDIDIRDEEVADLVREYVIQVTGWAPIRVGRAPKLLMLFSTETPFRKMSSPRYCEDATKGPNGKWNILGECHQVEILGDGQQCAAYHIHPDTNMPYVWSEEAHPAITPAAELPLLTIEQAQQVIDYFNELAVERGWIKVTKGRAGGLSGSEDDDWTSEIASKVDLSLDEVRSYLMRMPGREDYDGWLETGFAVYHQTGGSEDGRAIFHEWSATLSNYDESELDDKWDSGHFEVTGRNRQPVTFRTIIHYVTEAETTAKLEVVEELREVFRTATTSTDWAEACKKVRRSEIDAIARDEMVELAKRKYQLIHDGAKVTTATVRKSLAYELDSRKMPDWCKGWVYDTSDDRFICTNTKAVVSVQGFNAMNDRYAVTKKDLVEGRSTPSTHASELALVTYKIQAVSGRIYAPGEELIFKFDGGNKVNLYREEMVPEAPTKVRPMDKVNVRRVLDHVKHLLSDEEEQQLLMDWLAYCIQNPGKRVNWAILLQGTEGDGKSFFASMLRAVMGPLNVRPVNAKSLEGNFTDWAHGACVVAIEEVRMMGHNAHDVLNSIKPFITNNIIEIHPKGRPQFSTINTVNYMLMSNYMNALPLTENDRRYCILASRFQSGHAIRQFNAENPDYYRNLYRAIEDSGPAIRRAFLDHEISSDFPAGGNAPLTRAHGRMVNATKPEFLRELDTVVTNDECLTISDNLVSVTDLADELVGMGADMPVGQWLHRAMMNNGFVSLGRVRVGEKRHVFWTKNPEMFTSAGATNVFLIKRYLDERKKRLSGGEEDEL